MSERLCDCLHAARDHELLEMYEALIPEVIERLEEERDFLARHDGFESVQLRLLLLIATLRETSQ